MQRPTDTNSITEINEILSQIIEYNPSAHQQKEHWQEELWDNHKQITARILIRQLRCNQTHVDDLHYQQEDHLEHILIIKIHNEHSHDDLPEHEEDIEIPFEDCFQDQSFI